jgi:hypothetical protein
MAIGIRKPVSGRVCRFSVPLLLVPQDAVTTPDEAARALDRLAVIGAVLKREPGRYAINPHVGWVGDLTTRQKAAEDVPPVRLVDPVV